MSKIFVVVIVENGFLDKEPWEIFGGALDMIYPVPIPFFY